MTQCNYSALAWGGTHYQGYQSGNWKGWGGQ